MAKRRSRSNGLVYSTDPDRMRRGDEHEPAPSSGPSGPVRVRREVKGRKGKTVTTVTGIPLDAMELALLAKELKQKCGSGGTVKDGVVEIQGDHADKLMELLGGRGWDVKRAGG